MSLFQNTRSCTIKFELNYKSSNLNVNEEAMVVLKITLKLKVVERDLNKMVAIQKCILNRHH